MTEPMTEHDKHTGVAGVAAQLKNNAALSNRLIAAMMGVTRHDVARIRAELETTAAIPHLPAKHRPRRANGPVVHQLKSALIADPTRKARDLAKEFATTVRYVDKARRALEAAGTIPYFRQPRGRVRGSYNKGRTLISQIKTALTADPTRLVTDIAAELGSSVQYVLKISGDLTRRSGRTRKRARREHRAFHKAIEIIFNTCEHLAEVPVPELTDASKKEALPAPAGDQSDAAKTRH